MANLHGCYEALVSGKNIYTTVLLVFQQSINIETEKMGTVGLVPGQNFNKSSAIYI